MASAISWMLFGKKIKQHKEGDRRLLINRMKNELVLSEKIE